MQKAEKHIFSSIIKHEESIQGGPTRIRPNKKKLRVTQLFRVIFSPDECAVPHGEMKTILYGIGICSRFVYSDIQFVMINVLWVCALNVARSLINYFIKYLLFPMKLKWSFRWGLLPWNNHNSYRLNDQSLKMKYDYTFRVNMLLGSAH